MKRIMLYLLLALFLFGCGSSSKKPENPFRIAQSRTVMVDLNEISEIIYFYDEHGLLEKEKCISDGKLNCICSYEYDEWGNVILEKWDYDDGSSSVAEHILTFDENNRIVYRDTKENGELKASEEIEYDRHGNQTSAIEKIHIGKDFKICDRKMRYDAAGNIVERIVQWSNDPSLGGTTTFQYDKDQLVREEFYTTAGWMKSYVVYSYDQSGLIQTAMEYNKNDSLQSKTITTYDEYGNILKQEYYSHTGKLPGSGDEIADRVTTCTYEEIGIESVN